MLSISQCFYICWSHTFDVNNCLSVIIYKWNPTKSNTFLVSQYDNIQYLLSVLFNPTLLTQNLNSKLCKLQNILFVRTQNITKKNLLSQQVSFTCANISQHLGLHILDSTNVIFVCPIKHSIECDLMFCNKQKSQT